MRLPYRLLTKENIKKIIFCSGKIYYDLYEYREDKDIQNIAIVRIEQLYPIKAEFLKKILLKYPNIKNISWCQEEPKNMGAWLLVRDYIQWTLDYIKAKNRQISYIGRNPDATPATGYAKRHLAQQKEIIDIVFN